MRSTVKGFRMLSLVVLLLQVTACSLLPFSGSSNSDAAPTEKAAWLNEGSITLSRPIPSISTTPQQPVLGFLPQSQGKNGAWLSIDRDSKEIRLMQAEEVQYSVRAEGLGTLEAGSYSVVHKQKLAPWYAPDDYFVKRGLNVPAQGDKDRFFRGALGDFALFLDPQTPIHGGPLYCDDVGGVLLDDNDVARLYYSLQLGALIEVN